MKLIFNSIIPILQANRGTRQADRHLSDRITCRPAIGDVTS
jgi:hypothetical protein